MKEERDMGLFLNPQQKLYALSIYIDSLTFGDRGLDSNIAKQISKKIKSIAKEVENLDKTNTK